MKLSYSKNAQAIYLHYGNRRMISISFYSGYWKEFGIKGSKQPNLTGYKDVSFWFLGFCLAFVKWGSGKNV